MARKAKPGNSGLGNTEATEFVDRIENLLRQLDSMKGAYMAECKGVREDIREVYSEAEDQGLPKNALRAVVKTRELERRADECRGSLEGEDQNAYDKIRHSLGDLAELPLGQAALAAA